MNTDRTPCEYFLLFSSGNMCNITDLQACCFSVHSVVLFFLSFSWTVATLARWMLGLITHSAMELLRLQRAPAWLFFFKTGFASCASLLPMRKESVSPPGSSWKRGERNALKFFSLAEKYRVSELVCLVITFIPKFHQNRSQFNKRRFKQRDRLVCKAQRSLRICESALP